MGNIFNGEEIVLLKTMEWNHYGFCNICEGARAIEPIERNVQPIEEVWKLDSGEDVRGVGA